MQLLGLKGLLPLQSKGEGELWSFPLFGSWLMWMELKEGCFCLASNKHRIAYLKQWDALGYVKTEDSSHGIYSAFIDTGRRV